jgi:hypothetical protein
MKLIYLLVSLLFCSITLFGQTHRYTPTGVEIGFQTSSQVPDSEELAAANAYWNNLISIRGWSAEIKGKCSYKYNCHGFAWHVSDNGDTIIIPNNYDVGLYFNVINATYRRFTNPGKYSKVY